MSRYIRTNDNIFDMERFKNQTPPSENNFMWLIDTKKECDYTIRVKDIIKEADTIEELCEEFVGINNNEHQFLRAIPYKCSYCWNNGVYGAIWTNKGLIYVAKLNDKGELELI